jgi:hypothetical protein
LKFLGEIWRRRQKFRTTFADVTVPVGFDCVLWPRVDYGCVPTWSRGSLGFFGEVFEVMTQVDLGLTAIGRFDSADSAISANDAN